MRRLWTVLRGDIRLQLRNGFYFAAAFVALGVIGLMSLLEDALLLRVLPLLLATNLLIGTFYFNAAIVLLEKGEGVLESLVVTPLRTREYLLARLASLALLALLEGGAVVFFTVGQPAAPLPLLAGLLLLGTFLTLLGFGLVFRYDAIDDFMLPSVLIVSPLFVPLLGHLGVWESRLLLLHPLQPFLDLVSAGFAPLSTGRLLYALAGGLFWCALAFWWAERSFHAFVARPAGGGG